MTQTQGRRGPLEGYRVIEVATMVAGPYAGQILADLGAEVIKVEVLAGDPMRHSLPVHKGRSALFEIFNRGKRSIAVDVRTEAGLDVVRRLVRTADIFLENTRPGVMEKLGLGYEDLNAENDDLVYVSVNGFGSTGPLSRQPTYDVVVQGLTGFMYTQGGPQGVPAHIRAGIVDKIAATFAATSAMAALLNKDPSGRGQKINVNLLDSYASFMLPEVMTRFYFQELDESQRVNVSAGIFHNIETKDGFATGLIFQRKELEGAARAFDRPDLLEDERFSNTTLLVRNQDQLFAELSKVARNMTKKEVLARAVEAQIPIAPVNDIEEFFEDEQAAHNRSYLDFVDEEVGPIRTTNLFATFGRSPPDVRRLAPLLGENTDELLHELGIGDEDIAQLRTSRTIA